MTSSRLKGIRLGAALLAGGVFAAIAASPAPAQVAAAEDSGAALTRNLRLLSDQPRSIVALMGAGRAALELGDAQAALTFFARAEEVSPNNGKVKAGIASAFLMLEQLAEAERFFTEAAALGAPEHEMAGDRGLLRDLQGDPRRAQADYALVLARGDDPEIRRRYALSLAISGDRQAALRMIEPQLWVHDRAALRVRAFILALTGDAAAATEAVKASMPTQADELRPFLTSLPALTPAERAMAVHFGTFPENLPTRLAAVQQPAAAPSAKPGGREEPKGRRGRGREQQRASRSKPGENESSKAAPTPLTGTEAPAAAARPAPSFSTPAVATRQVQAQPTAQPRAESSAPVALPAATSASNAGSPAAAPTPPRARLADVAALIQTLPEAPEPPAQSRVSPQKPAATSATPSAKAVPKAAEPKKKAPPAKPKEPSRIWVQVAGGADKNALPREFTRLKEKAPALFAGKSAWTTPLRFTNRLLVGPFKTEKEARTFVNELAKLDLSAFSWTSPEGQEIEKLLVK